MTQRCGLVAIVGRPNVGKSTLLNHLLGQKISITSRKPQTTRHRIVGVKTEGDVQIVYVDTPGIHTRQPRTLNQYLNRAASNALADVDVVLFLVDRLHWNDDDERVLAQLDKLACPVLLLINKVDELRDKAQLLPHIEQLSRRREFAEVIPLSALRGHNLAELEQALVNYLPEGPFLFPEDQITDRSERFLVAEIIREKITRQLGDEVPYSMAVEIERFEDRGRTVHIHALILVERPGQKKIVIGEKGSRLRLIGERAREDIEKLLERSVMLKLWVKIKAGWADDQRALHSLGYDDRL